MTVYEVCFILPGDLKPESIKKVVSDFEALVKSSEGRISDQKEEKRELAYPIKKHTEGIYVFADVELPPDKVLVLDKSLTANEEVLRHLIVKKASKSPPSADYGLQKKKTKKKGDKVDKKAKTRKKIKKSVKLGKKKEQRAKKNGK